MGFLIFFQAIARASPTLDARPVVAVLYFDYLGQDIALAEQKLALTKRLINTFPPVGSAAALFKIVERERLDKVLTELDIDRKVKLDPMAQHRIGRALGAGYLVLGDYSIFAGRLQLDASIVDVETTEIAGAFMTEGRPDELMNLVQQLGSQLQSRLAELAATAPTMREPSRHGTASAKLKAARKLLPYKLTEKDIPRP